VLNVLKSACRSRLEVTSLMMLSCVISWMFRRGGAGLLMVSSLRVLAVVFLPSCSCRRVSFFGGESK
jgi:hypothetical protein